MPSFVHLHVHSEYSLLDGLGRVGDLVVRAKELGMPALALTDHGAMYGAIEFHKTAKKHGIQPIIGIEMNIAPRGMKRRDPKKDRSPHHIILLAKNNVGYHNLMQIATAAELEGFYYKPRVDKKYLAEHAQGLIALSGCRSGEIPRLILKGQLDRAREAAAWYRDAFGQGDFYLELQRHEGIPELKQVNEGLIALSKEMGIPVVATNDVHYVRPEEAKAQEILLCIQTNTTIKDPKHMTMGDESFYLKSGEEMAALFSDVPEAVKNSLLIAEKCNLDLRSEGYHLPVFEVPEGYDEESYLRHLCQEGLKERYAMITPEIEARLQHELRLIHQMGFDAYFLIVWDLVRHARDQDIWWNVRGSAAGSIVAYTLGITNLDPLKHGLIFERFLNPGRVTMPDIDLDFPDERRDEMIKYAVEKYGQDRVAQIITFGTMGARAAIRDAGRALDIPLPEVDAVAKMIPFGPKVKIQDGLDKVSELRDLYESKDYIKELIDTARSLEGVARHASTHAAGVVIADAPLINYTPLHRPTGGADGSIAVTQYPMETLDDIGLLKIDFLGLSTLTIMRKAVDLIRQNHGLQLDLHTIPTDDPTIFELLSSGEVTGVFQVESSGMRRVLTDMQPTRFEDIVAVLALYRPGPMEFIPDYIARKHGREEVSYIHPKLEPILRETHGICITGDAIVFDVRTGQRYRLDELGELIEGGKELNLQGINEKWEMDTGRVTRWIHNGCKPIYRLTLRNGASIKATADHKFLTEQGWRELRELQEGDYIATPKKLITQNHTYDKRKLRVLAYLLADGDIGNLAAINFVSKNPALIAEYERCLTAFPNLRTIKIQQARGVIRVSVAKDDPDAHYHDPNSLLTYLRRLGLKYPPGHQPGGVRAPEKFIPDFVFALDHDHIAWFLASLWDCDGYMSGKLCHYRTISRRLAEDIQTLLLKLGIQSTIYTSTYKVTREGGAKVQESYQVTVYDTAKLARWLQPYMVTAKCELTCKGRAHETTHRGEFIAEVEANTALSKRKLMARYGIDRQHFHGLRRQSPRISAHVVAPLAETLPLPETQRRLNLHWEKILYIEPAGEKDVYDVTVDGLHNFVANNIIVHNCVYQEQIIRILTDLAGYSAADADLMRRAVGKKKEKELLRHREIFIEGAIRYSGIEPDKAKEIFDAIEYFSNYGFNQAHAVSYAVITCQTAWLKAKYPLEYMAALLTVERNNTDKLGLFLAECHKMGIEILPPDVNRSGLDFTIETDAGSAIRFGLGAVKNVGEGPIEAILAARGQDGPFKDIEDFCQRVDLRQVNRRALECLIKIGALDAFGQRSQLLAIIDPMMALSQSTHQAREVGQLSMFDTSSGFAQAMGSSIHLPDIPEVPRKEMLAWEKELVGFYVSEHPLQQVAASLDGTVTAFCGEIDEEMAGQKVIIAGVVTWVRPYITRKGNPMAFVQLEDLRGSVEVIVFPSVYEKTRELWQEDRILVVKGRVDTKGRGPKVICESVQDYVLISQPVDEEKYRSGRPFGKALRQGFDRLSPAAQDTAQGRPRYLHITIPRTGEQKQDSELLGQVHSLLRSYKGDDRFSLYLVDDERRVQLDFPNATTGYCPALEEALIEMLGAGAIRVENQ